MTIFKTIMIGLGLLAATPALAGDVTIDLAGVQAANGQLYVGLQTSEQFLKDAGSHGTVVKAPKAGNHLLVIKDVPVGDYSVSVWHDTNGDGKFSKAPDGMPLDGWSMIGAESLRSEPQWEQAKFTASAGGTTVHLRMVYPK